MQIRVFLIILEKSNSFQILCDQFHFLVASTCLLQILQSNLVYWEQPDSCTVFRCHVADSCTIGKAESADSRSVKLNEFVDDSFFPEHLSAEQDEVGGSSCLLHFSSEFESYDLWQDHGGALTKHDRLSFDASNSPSNNSEAIDHGCVRVSAHYAVRVKKSL